MRLLCVLAIAMVLAASEARSEIMISLFDSISGVCPKASGAVISAVTMAAADVGGAAVLGEKVKAAFPDAPCDAAGALNKAKELIAEGVRLVIWSPVASSRMRLPAKEEFTKSRIMQISLSADDPAQAYAAVQVWAKAPQRADDALSVSRIADREFRPHLLSARRTAVSGRSTKIRHAARSSCSDSTSARS
jgi:ABC-type branched-subunit amino acid transport system substrate-binding protein